MPWIFIENIRNGAFTLEGLIAPLWYKVFKDTIGINMEINIFVHLTICIFTELYSIIKYFKCIITYKVMTCHNKTCYKIPGIRSTKNLNFNHY